MLVLAASLLLLASATVSPRAERALGEHLSSGADVAVVKARAVKGACAVVVLDVDAAVVVGDNVAAARGRGKDARGRACAVNVVVDIAWKRAAPAVPTGTPIGFRAVVGAVEVEGNGVVVPCGVADRDAGFVCVRAGNSNVRGVVEGGVVVVMP